MPLLPKETTKNHPLHYFQKESFGRRFAVLALTVVRDVALCGVIVGLPLLVKHLSG